MTSWIILVVIGFSLQLSDAFTSEATLCDYTDEDQGCQWDSLYGFPRYQVLYLGGSIVLPCNYSETPASAVAKSWLLNDLKTIVPLDWTSSDGRLWVSEMDGMTQMHITNITTEDFGLYHCMMEADHNTAWMLRIGLNIQGPYFEDLWEKYKWMSLAGTCAFFGFLFIYMWVWLIARYRWQPSEDDLSQFMGSSDRSRRSSSGSKTGAMGSKRSRTGSVDSKRSRTGSVDSKRSISGSGSNVSRRSTTREPSDGQSNPVYVDEISLHSIEENTVL